MNIGTALVKKQLYRAAFRSASGWQQWLDSLTRQGGVSSHYRPSKSADYTRTTILGVPVECWAPQGAWRKLVYLHGGMFSCPLTDGYRWVAEHIAIKTGRVVYCPDYAVYPNVYPTALEEIKSIWSKVADEDTVLLGDDAGGNMALVLAMQLRDEHLPLPTRLLLVSPLTDATCSGESYYDNYYLDPIGGQKALGGKDIKDGLADSPLWRYAGEFSIQNPRISPLWGRLEGLPATYVVVGGEEVWRSDGERLVKAITQSGGIAEVLVGAELWHCYPLAFSVSKEARQAFGWLFDHIN